MIEIMTRWSGPQGSGLRSIMYFRGNLPGTVTAARLAVGGLWAGYAGVMSNQYTFEVEETARLLDPSDGSLVGLYVDSGTVDGAGAQNQQPVADSTQVLHRWATGQVRNGRVVRGHQYAPGLATGSLTGGNITPAVAAALTANASDFVDDAAGEFCIWARPRPGLPGLEVEVLGGSVWGELAVLRQRRG